MKKSIIIASIVIVLALIGGGVFWYVKQGKELVNMPVVENNNLEEEQKGNELQGEEIDTSEWLTYRNEEYGFEVKYPEEWIIKEENNKFTFIDPDNYDDFYKWTEMEIGFWDNIDNLEEKILEPFKTKYGYKTLDDLVEKDINVFSYAYIYIDNVNVLDIHFTGESSITSYNIPSKKKYNSYILVDIRTYHKLKNTILSTIKIY